MIMKLPRASEPQGVQRASDALHKIANEQHHCAMLVFGDSAQAAEIAASAETRVGGDPSRLVVHIPDVSVLDASPELTFLATMIEDGVEAVAMTLDFKVSSRLRGEQALRLHDLEIAFARAQQGIES